MLPDSFQLKYPSHIWYVLAAITAIVFVILAIIKKNRIISILKIHLKACFSAIRVILLTIGLGLLVFSMAGPQVFSGYVYAEKIGLDIYLLLDTSKSMLTEDTPPNRLSVAKRVAETLLDLLDGDRVGFIPFASQAYIQMPLTDDYQLARMFLTAVDTDMVSGGGTSIASALKLAGSSFKRASGSDQVIVILSDGEEQDQGALSALQSIKEDGLHVYTVGIGTEKGGLIPVYGNDNQITGYMKDDNGNPVTSRLNATILSKLADIGNGVYYEIGHDRKSETDLINRISNLKRDVLAVDTVKKFQPVYQYFLLPGILCLLIALLLPDRRKA